MSDSDNTTAEAIKRDFSKTAASSSGGSSGLILALVFVAACGGIGYFLWQQHQELNTMQADYQTLSSAAATIDTLQQTQQQLLKTEQMHDQQVQQLGVSQQQLQTAQQQAQSGVQQQLQMALGNLNEHNGQLLKLNDEVATLRSKVAETPAGALRAQILAEVAGLLRLAEQRLQVAQDLDSAVAIVRNSDALLARLNDAAIAPLRNSLAGDLAALQAAQQNDVHKLYADLGDAIAALSALLPVSKTAITDPELKTNVAADSGEQHWWNRVLGFISQYFVVTHRDNAITPMLTPEQSWLIRKSIELQLQQARLAALNGDDTLYKATLKEAQAAITDNLQGDGKSALLAKLKALETAPLRSNIPSLTASLVAVQQLQGPAGRAGFAP